MSFLEVRDLNVRYGAIHAVQGVSLSVEQGEIVTLIGANGAGKSSTLNAIAGLVKCHGGSVQFDGKDITNAPTDQIVKAGLTQCMEGRQIFLKMSVQENLQLGGYTRPKSEIDASIDDAFSLFPILKERRNQQAGTLSGGEQQMLALSRALMCKPKLLMLDEPSLGLAPLIIREVFDHIRRINQTLGTTILLVEQNAKVALSVSDRGYVVERGKIQLSGTAQELLGSEQVEKAYLGG